MGTKFGATVVLLCAFVGENAFAQVAETTDVLTTTRTPPVEAPAGFDNETNGFVDAATHAADLAVFDEAEEIDEGLGPLYNAQGCRECHQSPISGAASQITELRVGHVNRFGRFVNPDIPLNNGSEVVFARSLVNDRAICPSAAFPNVHVQQRVPRGENVRTERLSLSTLGDGFIEAIASRTIQQIASDQCRRSRGGICGEVLIVPVLEAGGRARVARFGWKGQHASLLSFSADAYLNEMGITSTLLPDDVTKLCDTVAYPEYSVGADVLADVDRFARYIRATKAPARDPVASTSPDSVAGETLFSQVGCATCHVGSIVTAPAGSVVNAGAFTVPDALGNKRIHPYSDFLMHDVGTGDGIVQNGPPSTARKVRTPPLWGLRMRSRLMHDGQTVTLDDAVLRHRGEASSVSDSYSRLRPQERLQIAAFLSSL
ncbi:MAG: di-heme oxidoredictase family protein [bacterium]